MFGGGVIGDSRQVMLLLGEGSNVDSNGFEPIAIWAEHSGLGLVLQRIILNIYGLMPKTR